MRIQATLFIVALGVVGAYGQTWTSIATDPSGDSGGLDATSLEYWYDGTNDEVWFRITTTNLASYSTGPAADFSFQLPNGLDSGDPTGFHWTTPGTPVHKIGYVYCDPGGSAPDNYTFNNWPVYVEIASTMVQLCTNCITVEADVPNNQLIYRFDRQDIITDTEMGGATATILLVANVGHDVMWDDNITSGASFTIDMGGTGIAGASGTERAFIGPNPTADRCYLHLQGNAAGLERLDLYDLNGRLVRGFAVVTSSQGVVTLDLQEEATGPYVLEVRYQDGIVERHRLVVQ